jgi:uncharacterized protein YidB (DUF937 family)
MAKGMPSLLALLGLVAVAGYQNRDKLRDMIGDAQRGRSGGPDDQAGAAGSGGLLDEISQMFGSGNSGRNLSEGLGSLVDRFRNAGQGAKADSWVSTDANRELQPDELETAIGVDTIAELSRKTGLSRAELVTRLTAALPETVSRLTPDGRLPSETEAQRLI